MDQPAVTVGVVGSDDVRAAVEAALPDAAVEPLVDPAEPPAEFDGEVTAGEQPGVDSGVTAGEQPGVDSGVTAGDQPAVDCAVVADGVDDVAGTVAALTADSAPVVVYAADGDERLAADAVAAGAAEYVPAPDRDALAERVRAAAGAASAADRLVEQVPLAVVGWDESFTVTRWNAAAEALFGWSRAEALGEHALDLIVPADEREAVESVLRTLLADGEPAPSVNETVRKDGERRTCEWYNAPLVDDAGTRVVSFARDVTEQRRRSDRLAALQETGRELLRTGSAAGVAETVVGAAADVLDQPLASVRLYDDDTDRLEPVAFTPAVRERLPDPPAIDEGPMWEAFVDGEARTVEVVPSDPVYGADPPVAHSHFRPLGEHGVLTFGVDDPEELTALDRTLAGVLARTAEAALDRAVRDRELARYETIVQAAGDGVVALDAEGRYTDVNDRFAEMTGHDRERLVGADPRLVTDEAGLARADEHVRRLRDGDADRVTYEATMVRADGERVPVEVSQSELPGEGFTGTVGTVRDVSERKAAEAELAAYRRRLAALHDAPARMDGADTAEAVAEAAVAVAADVLAFDEAVLRRRVDGSYHLLATTAPAAPDVVEDGPLYAETHETDDPVLVDDLGPSPYEGPNPWGVRSVLSVPVDDEVVLQAVSRDAGAFDDSDRELAELLASHVADALDRVGYERRLRTERDRLAALFESLPDPGVLGRWDGEGFQVEAVNPAFERVFGIEEAGAVGRCLDDLVVPAGRADEAAEIDRAVRAGEVVQREVRRQTAEGLREFLLTGVPVEDDGDPELSYMLYTDVTERNQRRKRVAVLNRVLRHDLRNSLNVVRGAATQLRDEVGDEAAELAATVHERADELLALAEQIRTIERSLDRETVTTGEVDLAAAARECVAALRERFPAAQVHIDAPDRAVAAGEALLADAVHDVVENAVVHNDRPAPSVDVTVRVEDGTVVVRVADDGPGIPAAERRLLTGDDEITQLNHTSGLGLWLVNWAVTHSGGELSFADNDPRGSVVTVRVPAAATDASEPHGSAPG